MATAPGSAPALASVPLAPVDAARVRIADRFWAPRQAANRERTLPANLRQLRETGRIDALRLQWKEGKPNRPHQFWDSDVAKYIEAAANSLITHPDAALEAELDGIIALLAAAQMEDGYLNSYYQNVAPQKRWSNLRDDHELYCAGHLFEAAVAHLQATGKRTLLDVARRFARCIADTFGPGKARGYCGHPEIELALVRLWRATDEREWLDLARHFVDTRGQQPPFYEEEARRRGETGTPWHTGAYSQAHQPVREQRRVVGHAVRAMYLATAMADLAALHGDAALHDACHAQWDHLTQRQMYVTGGIGQSRHNEGFIDDWDLPNDSAYCETCAGIGVAMFASRLLQLDRDGAVADVLERALYNNVLAGASLDGDRFFYENPLASRGLHRRQAWFGCSCCPPNWARTVAGIGGYAYGEDAGGASVHLYIAGEARVRVGDAEVGLRVDGDYPWDGRIGVTVATPAPRRFALRLRIPGWCRRWSLSLGGAPLAARVERGYAIIEREWRDGERVALELDLPAERVRAHPRVAADRGRVALMRGPLVYCLEQADIGSGIEALRLPGDAPLTAEARPDLLGGVVVLRGVARREEAPESGPLYTAGEHPVTPREVPAPITAIPYFAWENRGPGEMAVWIRE